MNLTLFIQANTSQNRKGARDDNLQKGFAFYAKSNETDNTEKRNKLRTLADVHFQRVDMINTSTAFV